MRVNVYAEEMTDRIQIISKEIEGQTFTGLRLYLELPATKVHPDGSVEQVQAPFMHHPGDDDSSAVTFWGKRDLRSVLRQALHKLDTHYAARDGASNAMQNGFQFPNSIPNGTTVAALREALSHFPESYTVEMAVAEDFDCPTEFVSIEVGEGTTCDAPGHVVIAVR